MSDKRTQHKRRRDAKRDPVTGKSEYEKVMSGEIEPTGCQKGWKNLKPIPFSEMSEERALEVRKAGGIAVQKLHGERKTAKEVLENILTLKATDEILQETDLSQEMIDRIKRSTPNATLYDVMGAVALGRALSGNIKAAEYIRDTYGDKPTEKIDVTGQIMTESDRALLQQIGARLQNAEMIQVIDQDSSSEREKTREKEPKRE